MTPFSYARWECPPEYRCCKCDTPSGVRLWRGYSMSCVELLCVTCAEAEMDNGQKHQLFCSAYGKTMETRYSDQLGWNVPAVPCEDGHSYWGYTSVPEAGVNWWKNLPIYSVKFITGTTATN